MAHRLVGGHGGAGDAKDAHDRVTGRYINAIVESISKEPDKYELPVKIFSVGRVFRNENIDYKHLADFYQSDGIIIGKNLTLANLFDTLLKIYESSA